MTPALALALLLAPVPRPVTELPPAEVLNDLAMAPQAWERYRFPDSPAAEAALKFNARFRTNLEAERGVWPWNWQEVFDAADAEAFRLRQPWWHLAWAQWPNRCEWQRRLDLRMLRDCIGQEAFDAGRMPPAVPVWRYRSLR